MWHFCPSKVPHLPSDCTTFAALLYDFSTPKVPHLQFRICNLELFRRQKRRKMASVFSRMTENSCKKHAPPSPRSGGKSLTGRRFSAFCFARSRIVCIFAASKLLVRSHLLPAARTRHCGKAFINALCSLTLRNLANFKPVITQSSDRCSLGVCLHTVCCMPIYINV